MFQNLHFAVPTKRWAVVFDVNESGVTRLRERGNAQRPRAVVGQLKTRVVEFFWQYRGLRVQAKIRIYCTLVELHRDHNLPICYA